MLLFKKEKNKIFNTINLKKDFNPILSFLSEFCEVPHVFVSLIDDGVPIIKAEIGFDFLTIPERIRLINEEIVLGNKIIIVTEPDKEDDFKKLDSSHFSFNFFAGFPIRTDENEVVGTLCVMANQSKALSPAQLKSINFAVQQIESILKLQLYNTKLEETLTKQKNQFQLFVDNSKEILFELNLEGIFTYASKKWTDFLGFENDEILEKSITLIIHPEDIEMYITYLNTVFQTGKSKKQLAYRILNKEGNYVWYATNLEFLEKEGKPVFIEYYSDSEEHIKIQQKLLQEKEFYEKILDRLPTDVAVFDSNSKYIYLNPMAIKNDELRKFIIGKDDFEYAKHTGRDDLFAKKRRVKFLQALESRNLIEWEDSIQLQNGEINYHNRKFAPVFLENGALDIMVGFGVDITASKKLKDELQQSEEQFKGVFENSAVGMALVDIEGYYIEVNERLCEIFGYSEQELKFLKFHEITHYEDLALDLDNKEKIDSGKIKSFSSEKRFIHKNKTIIWAQMFVSVAKNSKNEIKHYIVQIIDITARKKVEEQNRVLTDEINKNKAIQLNEAKNMYRLLAENTADLVCLHHLDASFSYVSPSIHKLLGYVPEELIGKFPTEIVHAVDMKILENRFEDFVNGQEGIAVEIRCKNKKGNYYWFESNAVLVKENGIPIGFQSSTRDISQRKEAEKIVKNTLIQQQKLNELRTNLVATVSHEFRTPMTTIRTSAELISMYLEGHNFENSIPIQKRLNIINGEIDSLVELMNAVLTISKEDSGNTNFNPVAFDLKKLCLAVIDSSCTSHDKNIKVKTSFKGDYFHTFADKSLMEYCIVNVLNNAFKYSNRMKDIIFNVFTIQDTIVIEITDFGIGIPKEDQSKIFNTFFRASNTDAFQGTGLGLYIVKNFAEKNSGTVQLESQVGIGTKVTLKFPLKTK